MQELRFREVPAARYEEDELGAALVQRRAGRCLPETFRYALCSEAATGALLLQLHPEIFDARWWRAQQQRIAQGHVEEVIAWRQTQRFSVCYGADKVNDRCTPA